MNGHADCLSNPHPPKYCLLNWQNPGGKNISILHLSCRTSDLQFSLVLQTYSPSFKRICNKECKGVICNMTSLSNSSQSTHPTGWELWREFLVLSRFHSELQADNGIFVPWTPFRMEANILVHWLWISEILPCDRNLSYPCYLTLDVLKLMQVMVVKWCHHYVKVTSSYHVAAPLFRNFSETFLRHIMPYLIVSKKNQTIIRVRMR